MITVHHESRVITLGISFHSTKNHTFSVGKKSFLGGMSKMITILHGGLPGPLKVIT